MKALITAVIATALLAGCGGGGDNTPTPPAAPVKPIVVSLSLVDAEAIESINQIAKFKIDRTGGSAAVSLDYNFIDNPDVTKGTASASDYQLTYSDGGEVGSSFELGANQNSRVIEVRPVDDDINEVPEILMVSLVDAGA